jgi:hypothetical protein
MECVKWYRMGFTPLNSANTNQTPAKQKAPLRGYFLWVSD